MNGDGGDGSDWFTVVGNASFSPFFSSSFSVLVKMAPKAWWISLKWLLVGALGLTKG